MTCICQCEENIYNILTHWSRCTYRQGLREVRHETGMIEVTLQIEVDTLLIYTHKLYNDFSWLLIDRLKVRTYVRLAEKEERVRFVIRL